MFKLTKALMVFFSISACAISNAAEYWVAKTGNDNNQCSSQSDACLTIQKGITKLNPGDTLNIGGGIYKEDSANNPYTSKCGLLDANYGSICAINSGTPDQPIVIRAQPGEEGKVIIDSEGKRAGLLINKRDYIHIKNLTFQNSWTAGIGTVGGPSGVAVDASLSIGCLIEGNIILKTRGANGVNNSAIYMWSTKDWIVRNNQVIDVYGNGTMSNGIQSYGTINALIENNTISQVDHGINWKDHYTLESKTTPYESLIRNNVFSVAVSGIRISIRGAGTNPAGSNEIRGNIFILEKDSTTGIGGFLREANGLSGGLLIENNLFIGRVGNHKAINVDSVVDLQVIGNVFAGVKVPISLRLEDINRPAKLTVSDYNIFDSATIQFQNDKYGTDQEDYNSLASWQAAKPSVDTTITSLQRDNPDQHSIQLSGSAILTKASQYSTLLAGGLPLAKTDINFSADIPQIKHANGSIYQPGPYQKPGQIIGASEALNSAPDITDSNPKRN